MARQRRRRPLHERRGAEAAGRLEERMFIAALVAALLAAAPAPERRCGWLQNPTPANYWLIDRDGEWTIGAQGGYQAPGHGRDARHDDARLGRDQRPLRLWLRLHDCRPPTARAGGSPASLGDAGAASPVPRRPRGCPQPSSRIELEALSRDRLRADRELSEARPILPSPPIGMPGGIWGMRRWSARAAASASRSPSRRPRPRPRPIARRRRRCGRAERRGARAGPTGRARSSATAPDRAGRGRARARSWCRSGAAAPDRRRRARSARSISRSTRSSGDELVLVGPGLQLEPVEPLGDEQVVEGHRAPRPPRRPKDRRPGRRRCGRSRSSPAGPGCPTSRRRGRGAIGGGTVERLGRERLEQRVERAALRGRRRRRAPPRGRRRSANKRSRRRRRSLAAASTW